MNKYLKVIIIVLSIVGLFIWTFIGFPYLMWRDSGSYYEYFGSSSNIQLVSNNSEINDSENNFDLIVNYLINDDFNITENSINDFEFKYFVEKDITYGGEVTISNYTISIESYYHRHNYLVEKLDDHNNLPFEKEYNKDKIRLEEFNEQIIVLLMDIYDVYVISETYERIDGGYNAD